MVEQGKFDVQRQPVSCIRTGNREQAPSDLPEVRCPKCKNLQFKGWIEVGEIEIRCRNRRCKYDLRIARGKDQTIKI
jgi:hypothetical protein